MSKVSIVGCGKVGMTAAYALLINNVCDELVLYGRHKDELIGEQLDLEHSMAFLGSTHVHATDSFAELANSDIVVVSAGAAQEPGETRLDLVGKNKKVMEQLLPGIMAHTPNAVIVMVTNPVDVLTNYAYQITGAKPGQIFGTGTTLDTARFRFHLSEFLHINPRSIHAYILGEHGDTSFPALSSANVGGQALEAFPHFTHDKAMQAFDQTKQAAYKIIQAKGATFYAIGVVVSKIVSTILRDKRSVLPVSIPIDDYYGHSQVALSVPCIVGKNGVSEILKVSLSTTEQEQLAKAVETLRQYS